MTARHPLHLTIVGLVAVGGAVGACARHRLSTAFTDPTGEFPWTTFGINVAGCFLLALLPALAFVRRRALLPPLFGTGVLGGFTTMSAYSEQARALVADGSPALATVYVVGTLAASLVAVAVADRFSSTAERAEFENEEGDL
ncbi:MAG TPA: CrcB family protein [Nocardioidaceae bacterium]|nr:CrcB family protein [Nocardioidaceae bacterium]